jgi:hypothetical protein
MPETGHRNAGDVIRLHRSGKPVPPGGPVLRTSAGNRSGAGVKGALGEIDFLAAGFAGMGFVELVGKDLNLFAACRAFALKGFKVFKLLKSGAMLGCRHVVLLQSVFDCLG